MQNFNYFITIMGSMVKRKINQDVREAVEFSVEMDSKQEDSVKEQRSIIQRGKSAGEAFLYSHC